MSELSIVELHHNEPMTTSEAIAEGTGVQHKNVLEMVRKFTKDLIDFGEVAFQTRLNPQGSPTEVIFLNEQQATFLLTLMRNSEIVVAFKKALVKAFFELRDRACSGQIEPILSGNLSHSADLCVAADRIFRGFLRSARTAGLSLPKALRIANDRTRQRTGMNMLSELEISPDELQQTEIKPPRPTDDMSERIVDWLADEAQAMREEFALREFLIGALGIPVGHRDWHRFETAAGIVIRRLGFSKIERRNGPHRYLYRRPAV